MSDDTSILLSVAAGAAFPYVLVTLYLVYDRIATWLYWRKRIPDWGEAFRGAAQRYADAFRL